MHHGSNGLRRQKAWFCCWRDEVGSNDVGMTRSLIYSLLGVFKDDLSPGLRTMTLIVFIRGRLGLTARRLMLGQTKLNIEPLRNILRSSIGYDVSGATVTRRIDFTTRIMQFFILGQTVSE